MSGIITTFIQLQSFPATSQQENLKKTDRDEKIMRTEIVSGGVARVSLVSGEEGGLIRVSTGGC
jgi:hypothetical protein